MESDPGSQQWLNKIDLFHGRRRVEWRGEAIEQNFTRPRLVHGVCIQLIRNNNNNNNSDLVSVKGHGQDDVQDR